MEHKPMSTEHLWELFSAKLKSFFLTRVSDEQVAEDLLQETFLRIHKNLDHIHDQQRIHAWIFQIARNLVIDHYRAKGRTTSTIPTDDTEELTPEEDNLNKIVMSWLPKLIAQLPDNYRKAVELYELEGMPQQKIAEILNISLSGTKSRVQRGREKLKSILFDCCSFEKDQYGNVIGYVPNNPDACGDCEDEC